jgi:hypothetical protein
MDAILGLLNNPVVLNILGIVMKFVPGVRTVIANRLIPVILSIVAWIGSVVSPTAAVAFGGPFVSDPTPVLGAGFFGLGGVLGGLGSAVWQASQAFLLNEMFTRHFMPPKPKDSK